MTLLPQDSKIFFKRYIFNSGVSTLKSKDLVLLNDAQPVEGGVKIVVGAGTGLG